jgi:preprotein translocase subunit SecF
MDIQEKIGYDFIGNRKITFVISLVIIILGVGSILIKGGLDFGIDFVGGTLVEVRFNEIPEVNDVRKAIDAAEFKEAVIQRLGEGDVILIRVVQESDSASAAGEDEGGQITKALEAEFGEDSFVINRVEQVGPQVGSELRRNAQLALLFAISLLILYISWRFESKIALPVVIVVIVTMGLSSWNVAIPVIIVLALIAVSVACIVFDYHFAFTAIVALIHDVAITVGVFSLTGREITLPVVAALLAIIGYSLNDTIVIFDRIRENIRLMGRKSPLEVLDTSIRQTLSRTILTSLTTLIVVVVLLIVGGHVINSFAFALFIGVITGTYSSIFVATPLLYEWNARSKGGIFRKA